MQSDTTDCSWHALFVITGSEDNVKQRLEFRFDQSLKFHVPKRRLRERKGGTWKERIITLFPGYILLNGTPTRAQYSDIRRIPGLIRPLKSESGLLSISDDEIYTIAKLTCNNDIIGFSSVLFENGQVRVVDGPLFGLEGRILSINHRKGRARVNLSFLGEDRTVELGITVLESV